MEAEHWILYLTGIPVMLGVMSMIDRHTLREAFGGSVLWPVTLLGLMVFLIFYRPMVRAAKRRKGEP